MLMENELLDKGHEMGEITNRVLSLFKYIQALNTLRYNTSIFDMKYYKTIIVGGHDGDRCIDNRLHIILVV